mmetsp:Transcript_29193/g.93819  ORF Transcript_29193/g.93819 Transcript_29193/m.93819 type:complete len:256 (-) Transcript_29193:131-898(-)
MFLNNKRNLRSSETLYPNEMQKFVDLRYDQGRQGGDLTHEIDELPILSPTRCPSCQCCIQNRALRAELYKQRQAFVQSEEKKGFLMKQLEEALQLLERHSKLSSALQRCSDQRKTMQTGSEEEDKRGSNLQDSEEIQEQRAEGSCTSQVAGGSEATKEDGEKNREMEELSRRVQQLEEDNARLMKEKHDLEVAHKRTMKFVENHLQTSSASPRASPAKEKRSSSPAGGSKHPSTPSKENVSKGSRSKTANIGNEG